MRSLTAFNGKSRLKIRDLDKRIRFFHESASFAPCKRQPKLDVMGLHANI